MIPYALNLIDLAFTLHAIKNGAVEANPLMQNIPVMIIYKVVIIGLLCWWLEKKNSSISRLGLWLCAAVYTFINMYHLYFILGG